MKSSPQQTVSLPNPGVAVKHSGRDPTLPIIYRVNEHPLREGKRGNTYIYYQDTSKAGIAATWKREKERRIPGVTVQQAKAKGASTPDS